MKLKNDLIKKIIFGLIKVCSGRDGRERYILLPRQ